MSIIVNPHNSKEEKALLAFLDSMKYDYIKDNGALILSEEQQQEILERDRQYEAGEIETFSLNEIIAHFNIKEQ